MQFKKWSIISALIGMALLRVYSFAETPGAAFLNITVGAEAQALGGASLAKAKGASAVSLNPAQLYQLGSKEILFYRSQWIADSNYNYVSYAHPLNNSKAGFGFAFGRFSSGSQEGRNELGQRTSDFSAADQFFSLSYGMNIGPKLSIGAGAKLIRSSIGDTSANGFAFDLSASRPLSTKTNFALGLFNAGPRMKYDSESNALPTTLVAGLSHELVKSLTFTSDVKYGVVDKKTSLSFGSELALAQIASFRLGYLSQLNGITGSNNSKLGSLSGLGMGIGFNLLQRMKLDYAFIPMGEFEGTHHIGFSWRLK